MDIERDDQSVEVIGEVEGVQLGWGQMNVSCVSQTDIGGIKGEFCGSRRCLE